MLCGIGFTTLHHLSFKKVIIPSKPWLYIRRSPNMATENSPAVSCRNWELFYCHVRLPEGMWCHFCTWEPRVTTYLNSIVAGSGAPVECRYIQIPSIDFLKLLPCLKQSQVTAGLGSTVGSSPSYGFKLWSSSCTWRSEAALRVFWIQHESGL